MTITRDSLEKETCDYFFNYIKDFFIVKGMEVWGVHLSGKRKRIDAVIYPNENLIENGFPKINVGIELKAMSLKDGNKKQAIELYKQSISYRHTRFEFDNSMHFLPLISIYPPISNYLKKSRLLHSEEQYSEHFYTGFQYFADRLSGLYCISELFLERDMPNIKLLFKLSGVDYFILRKNGYGHKYNNNWGFERYEIEKNRIENANLSPGEYEREIRGLIDLIEL